MSTVDKRYPVGTIDLIAVTLTLADGTTPAANLVSLASTAPDVEPASGAFTAATVLGSAYGKLLTGSEASGTYRLWAKVNAGVEQPIYDCGLYYITTAAEDSNRGAYPIDPTTPVGLVRLLDGDTDATNTAGGTGSFAWYSDAEITGLLGIHGTPQRTAIYILRLVSMTPALILKKWTSADLSVDGAAITEALKIAIDGIEASIKAGNALANADNFSMVATGTAELHPDLSTIWPGYPWNPLELQDPSLPLEIV